MTVSVMGLFIQTTFWSKMVSIVFGLLFSIYLVIDTQLIIGSKKHSLELDDYVLGTVLLYLDIINLFLEILKAMGESDD